MRVIAGKKRGKKLEHLKETAVRPTTDKVKESIFNVIQFDVPNSNFLDLFAGSGQIGIEALSRGACKATFVDKSPGSIKVTRRNLVATGFVANANVVNMDSILFLKRVNPKFEEKFDISFLDPPYNSEMLDAALVLVTKVMEENGIVICEHPSNLILPGNIANFYLTKAYKYGKIAVSIYRGS